ncbi:DUF262 domain-containing protein [Sphingobacterium sp. UME9]|uniref:DUF262 domain-containing protein n=1 Tax=Sphingobacterium sp. UME9 TaxID=1862316 RepID=UPI001600FE22|nr:DUF262 domain-containing protein [Sphingobacterium sp. UME9]MBB1644950.1 hypothetical protein [Sphingobacterium sp. UME9]
MKRQPTVQQVTWFLDLYNNKQIELNPPYQRKSVWSTKDRKFFLDTIFRNYPVPPIFIHRDVDDAGKTTYNIVDGKQRLETIFMFYENKISIDSKFNDENLNNKKFKDLSIENKRKFWDYSIVADFIEINEGNNVEDVFDRVNRNSRNLLPQELRHARFNGWFINVVENEANDQLWADLKITTKSRDKRMRNIQFVSELYMIILNDGIAGFDQLSIDDVYANYDDITENDSFSEEDFNDTLNQVKREIQKLINENPQIKSVISGSNNHLYTLWAFIYENELMLPQGFSDKYQSLLDRLATIKEEQNIQDDLGKLAKKYSDNSTGAATDFPQRKARLEVLNSL